MVNFTEKEFQTIIESVFIDPEFIDMEVIKIEYKNEYVHLINNNEEFSPDTIDEVDFSEDQHDKIYNKIEDLRFELEHERFLLSKEPTIEEEQGLWNNY